MTRPSPVEKMCSCHKCANGKMIIGGALKGDKEIITPSHGKCQPFCVCRQSHANRSNQVLVKKRKKKKKGLYQCYVMPCVSVLA